MAATAPLPSRCLFFAERDRCLWTVFTLSHTPIPSQIGASPDSIVFLTLICTLNPISGPRFPPNVTTYPCRLCTPIHQPTTTLSKTPYASKKIPLYYTCILPVRHPYHTLIRRLNVLLDMSQSRAFVPRNNVTQQRSQVTVGLFRSSR